jgi:multidrug resistance efflux pump
MSIQEPLIELLQGASPSHGGALVRRRHQVSLPSLPVGDASRFPGPCLAWAVFGILAGVAAALAGVVAALVYLLLNRPAEATVPARSAPVAAMASTAEQPSESSASSRDFILDCKGYILPLQRILVSPKVSGIIVKLHIREGCHVKKGDVLAELEDVDYKADFFRAQWAVDTARQQLTEAETSQPKEIGQAEAELDRAKVELSQLQADFARTRDLYYKQATSQTEYETSGTKFHAAEQHVRSMDYALGAMRDLLSQKIATAHTQLQVAEAELVKVRRRLESCMVRAPSSGTILKKNAEEGNLVNENLGLCELANLSELEVELAIPEREIHKIEPGQRCKVRTEAFPDRVYDGVVSRVMPVANRVQSAIPIRVTIAVPQEEEGVYLKPEMVALVSLMGHAEVAGLNETGTGPYRSPAHAQRQPPPPGAAVWVPTDPRPKGIPVKESLVATCYTASLLAPQARPR